ncbi:MAG: hypothetical protein EON58_23385 [Alphaproteobacteria bacterium]|nr:MAG: hypothetical protein EON58_23385 [Alphaproteobacteria bacterium]
MATIEASGKGSATLAARVAELEGELEDLRAKRRELEAHMGGTEAKRPSVATVSASWRSFGKVWEVLTEEERSELLPLLVDEVRMTAKNEGTLQLILQGASVENHGSPSIFSETSLSKVRNYASIGCGRRTYLEQFPRQIRAVCDHRRGNRDAEAVSRPSSHPLHDVSR